MRICGCVDRGRGMKMTAVADGRWLRWVIVAVAAVFGVGGQFDDAGWYRA